jgi:hypothetical protein
MTMEREHRIAYDAPSRNYRRQRRYRYLLAMSAPLLALFAPQAAWAGPLENAVNRIENRVNTINTRAADIQSKTNAMRSDVGTVLGNTNGVQDLVGNVRDITASFSPDLFDDIRAALQDAQSLLEIAKEQVVEARDRRASHPDLLAFVTGMEKLVKALPGAEAANVDLGVLTKLLGILPDKVLDVAGQGLLTAGIDQAFVGKLDQAAADVTLLSETEEAESKVFGDGAHTAVPFIPAGTGCAFDRMNVQRASRAVLGLGRVLDLGGNILAAMSKTTASGNITKNIRAGVHGYASLNIENDTYGMLAKLMGGVSDRAVDIANFGGGLLRHCEVLHYQRTMLEEICALSRYRSAACQHWDESAEADALRMLP